MAHVGLQHEFMDIPVVTRFYTSACIIVTVLVQLELISPFQLYFNPILIFRHFQIWRLATTFMFFGTIGFTFLFNLIFTYRYCRMLEENSFRSRTADFVFMLLFGATGIVICGMFCSLLFLGQALTIMLVYIWARRNPMIRISFFGILNFNAPYLPWVFLGFSLIVGNSPLVDIIGIMIGHIYYFLEDIFPRQSGGIRLLKTPRILKSLLDPAEEPVPVIPAGERPGGFRWGENEAAPPENQQ